MSNKSLTQDCDSRAITRVQRSVTVEAQTRKLVSAVLLCLALMFIYSENIIAQTSDAAEVSSSDTEDLDLSQATSPQTDGQAADGDSAVDAVLGNAEITESRRENGQRYRIELDHSGGAKQYIEENDSDGKIESTDNDIEETPNLPKWKLGSW